MKVEGEGFILRSTRICETLNVGVQRRRAKSQWRTKEHDRITQRGSKTESIMFYFNGFFQTFVDSRWHFCCLRERERGETRFGIWNLSGNFIWGFFSIAYDVAVTFLTYSSILYTITPPTEMRMTNMMQTKVMSTGNTPSVRWPTKEMMPTKKVIIENWNARRAAHRALFRYGIFQKSRNKSFSLFIVSFEALKRCSPAQNIAPVVIRVNRQRQPVKHMLKTNIHLNAGTCISLEFGNRQRKPPFMGCRYSN